MKFFEKMEFIHYLFSLKRTQKRIVSIIIDVLLLSMAFWAALLVKVDEIGVLTHGTYWLLIAFVIPLSIFAFAQVGLYRAILRYIGLQALLAISVGVIISTLCLMIIAYFLGSDLPRTVPIIYAAFAVIFIGGTRVIVRSFVGGGLTRIGEPVIIYGAGVSGRQLVTALVQSHEYYPFAFVDDDITLQGSSIQGVRVHSPSIIRQLISDKHATKVLLAIPSASRFRRKEILLSLESLVVPVLTLPAMADLVSGNKLYSDIKEVEIDDLLGRDSVTPRHDLMTANIKDKVVMVTGAGGSIGSELCRQIIRQLPNKLVLFELSEFALYSIEKELLTLKFNENIDVEVIPLMALYNAKID